MLSYSQRFTLFYRYFASLTEELLAATILFPMTTALYAFNLQANTLSHITFLPDRTDRKVWRLGHALLTIPLYVLNGIVSTLTMPLAMIFAISQRTPPSPKLIFGKIYNNWANIFQFVAGLYFMGLFFVPFLCGVISLGGLGFLTGRSGTNFLSNVLSISGISLYHTGIFVSILSSVVPYTLPILAPFLSLPMGVVATIGFIEGRFHLLSKHFSSLLNYSITYGQSRLRRFGWNTFRNNEDIDGMPVDEIPDTNLFVSNSNHAFNLASLQANLERGLQNYYITTAPGQPFVRLDNDDVNRLAQHSHLNQFPQLRRYLRNHRNEYTGGQQEITETTTSVMRNLARAMIAPMTAPRFQRNLIAAYEAYQEHLTTLSASARRNLINVNILGGDNPQYRLENALNNVFRGEGQNGWCKHAVGVLIEQMTVRWRNGSSLDEPSVFWQREEPTPLLIDIGPQ